MWAGLSSTEQQRFSVEDGKGSQNFELATMDSNTWVEVNYTQLVANAQRLLALVKTVATTMGMVKVRHCHNTHCEYPPATFHAAAKTWA